MRFAFLGTVIAALYALLVPIEVPDFPIYYYPWLEHIGSRGPVSAFSEPFANYTPPYLYLLAVFSLLPASPIVVVKALAIVILCWLAYAVRRLCRTLEATEPAAAGLFVLCLPTVILNGPGLGQCDALWVSPCLLALAAAAERRIFLMAAWAGVAFAFKAQAAFFAPLCLAIVINEREWKAPLLVPLIYLAAVIPAALIGWPLLDLLTIYVSQAGAWFRGNAPNGWAIPVTFGYRGSFIAGYLAAGVAALGYIAFFSQRRLNGEMLLKAALLSAILFPFLLPKMHERYFFLADILAFVLVYWRRDRESLAIFLAVQIGSLLSLVGYLAVLPLANAIGSVAMAGALLILILSIAKGEMPISRVVRDPVSKAECP